MRWYTQLTSRWNKKIAVRKRLSSFKTQVTVGSRAEFSLNPFHIAAKDYRKKGWESEYRNDVIRIKLDFEAKITFFCAQPFSML